MPRRLRYIESETLKDYRRRLRINNTKAEYVLWQELRRNELGHRFRRQTSIGRFIVDFYCHKLRLIIEVDGPIHDHVYSKQYDKSRENWLLRKGYIVIHFTNEEILFDRERVLEIIKIWCEKLSK